MKFPSTKWLCGTLRVLASVLALSASAQTPDPSRPPTLRIIAPEPSSSGPLSAPVDIVAELDGPAGIQVRQVRIESDGVDLGEAEALPRITVFPPPPARFLYHWPAPSAGTHRIRASASAVEEDGVTPLRLLSEAISYTVTNRQDDLPTVTVHTLLPSIVEGSGPRDVFEVRRTGPISHPLDVVFQLGGQATPGVDYGLPFNLLRAHFDAGAESVKVVLRPAADTRSEGRESVVLGLVQPEPPTDLLLRYRVGSPARAETSILDVGTSSAPSITWLHPENGSRFSPGSTVRLGVSAIDPSGYLPSVQFVATDAAGTERRILGRSDIAFIIAPTNGTPIGHVLDWVSTNGFAGINRIRAHSTTPAGDVVVSPDLLLVGIPQVGSTVVRVVTEVASASENAPESTFVFRIERDGPTEAPLTVRYSVSGTATRGLDYQLERDPCPLCARPTLLLPENEIVFEAGIRSIRVGGAAFTDRLVEGDESVEFHLEPAVAQDASYRIDPNAAEAKATLEDADVSQELPTVTLQTLDGVGSETNRADGLRFEIQRSGPTNTALVVHYRFSGSAQYLADFKRLGELDGVDPSLALPAPLLVEIPAGGTNAFLDLEVLPDSRTEGEETVVVTLIQPVPSPNIRLRPTYQVGRPESARGLIRDTPTEEGETPTVGIAATAAEIREPAPGTVPNPVSFTLTRSGRTGSPLTVRYTVSGTASNGRDYAYLDGDITIPAGAETASVRLLPLPDSLVEPDETVVLTLSAGRHYSVAGASTATVVLHDAVSGPDPLAWIRMLTPLDGARFTQPANVVFRVVAVDVAADIRRVEFLEGEEIVGISEHLTRDAVIPGAPRIHEWTWTHPPTGTHRIHARADVRGTPVRSEAVVISVTPAPTNSTARPHPADLAEPSFTLDDAEFRAYADAWRNGADWPGTTARIPASFVSRAGYLTALGGRYAWREEVREPLAWIPSAPTNVTGSSLAKDESTKPVLVSLVETTLSGFVDTSVLDLPSIWPEGMPEREPLSFAVLEVQRPDDRPGDADLVLRLLPATGTRSQVAEVAIGRGMSVTNLSDNGIYDPIGGVLRFGPFLDDANRRVTATVSGGAVTELAGLGSFDGRDVRFRIVESRPSSLDPARPRIASVERRNDGAVQVVVVDDAETTAPSVSFLECSDDLVSWRRIGEVPGTAVGAAHVDADASDTPVRYYRVSRP